MAQSERMKRPMPERTEPDRSWRGAFGAATDASRSPSEVASAVEEAQSPDRKGASYDAINDAYRVIDDYLRQGQRMAEQFWLPATGSNSPMNSFGPIVERFMRSAGDMGTAWFEMMTQWSTPPRGIEVAQGTAGPFGAGKTTRHSQPGFEGEGARDVPATGGGVSVQVESTRKFQISVDLFDASERGDLELHGLGAAELGLSPITNVLLERDPSSRRITVRIHVPEGQPPGVYNGMLLERETHRPRGTVSLSLA
ncbi:MAG: hypothetical protein ACLP1X_05340 [Polyangiaceae bacterium]|jgi:hypothetical protein